MSIHCTCVNNEQSHHPDSKLTQRQLQKSHVTSLTNIIMSFNSPSDATIRAAIIDDQLQSGLLGMPERSYGSYLSSQLKQSNPPLAALNNDNFMYFALVSIFHLHTISIPYKHHSLMPLLKQEAYWYPIVRPQGGFAPADRECLDGCTTLVRGNCLWCWTR